MKKGICLILLLLTAICLSACTPGSSPVKSELLSIDQTNVYEGMDVSYGQGYSPKLQFGSGDIILPLTSAGDIQDSRISIENVGSAEAGSSPFQSSYLGEKDIRVADNPVNGGAQKVPSYLIKLIIFKEEGTPEGQYPVTISVSYTTPDGTAHSQDFTVNVNVLPELSLPSVYSAPSTPMPQPAFTAPSIQPVPTPNVIYPDPVRTPDPFQLPDPN